MVPVLCAFVELKADSVVRSTKRTSPHESQQIRHFELTSRRPKDQATEACDLALKTGYRHVSYHQSQSHARR